MRFYYHSVEFWSINETLYNYKFTSFLILWAKTNFTSRFNAYNIRDLKIRRHQREGERQKNKNNNFSLESRTTTTWNCLVSRFREEVHKRRRNFLSLSELGYGSQGFNFKRVNLHLTKLVTWSYCDEDWKNANSLFQRHFCYRRRSWILRSLIYLGCSEPSNFVFHPSSKHCH